MNEKKLFRAVVAERTERDKEDSVQEAFDVISGCSYRGPLFRECLRRNPEALEAAKRLARDLRWWFEQSGVSID